MHFFLCFAKTGIEHYQFNVHIKSFCFFASSGILNFTDFFNNIFEFCFSDYFTYFFVVDIHDNEYRNVTYDDFYCAIRDFNFNPDDFLYF